MVKVDQQENKIPAPNVTNFTSEYLSLIEKKLDTAELEVKHLEDLNRFSDLFGKDTLKYFLNERKFKSYKDFIDKYKSLKGYDREIATFVGNIEGLIKRLKSYLIGNNK